MTAFSPISAVSRTMEVLEALADRREGLTVTELTDRVRAGKSVVSRILTTLADGGYVLRDPATDRYRLALKLLSIAHRHAECWGFPEVAQPILQRLADESEDLVQLGVVEGGGMRYVAKAEGNQRIRMLSLIGREVPLHASSMGKVWLASLPQDEVLRILAARGLPRYTPKTITSLEQLFAELKLTAERGYGTVVEELIEGAAAVGRPVRIGPSGLVVGAVSITGPIFRMTPERLVRLAELLEPAAEELAEIWPRDAVRAGGDAGRAARAGAG